MRQNDANEIEATGADGHQAEVDYILPTEVAEAADVENHAEVVWICGFSRFSYKNLERNSTDAMKILNPQNSEQNRINSNKTTQRR